jgi:peptidase M28-like protein
MNIAHPPSAVGSVDAKELMAHMQQFARWMKLSGTADELESLKYVRAKMKEYGFRTTLLSHDAYISLPVTARVSVDGEELRSITHSFSQPSPPEGASGDLVYVGQGHAADFAKLDVRGRIVLVDGIATPDVSYHATRAGARAQLHISPREELYEMCVSPVWGSPSQAKRSELPKTVIATVPLSDGERLRDRLAAGEQPRVVIHAEVDTGWRKTPILVADMDAADTSDHAPFVMLSGHHDTWYYGVMDNGGANATMLEVARNCAQRRQEWKRGLRLCFWSGHSHGRYSGSAWYADEHWDEIERRCVAHVNVDSTGGIGASVLADTASMSGLHSLAAEAIKQQAGQNYVGKRRGRAGDESFGGIGVFSMFGPLSEQAPDNNKGRRNLGWWWHTPEDTIDKIDEGNLARDTRVVFHAIWRLVSDPVLPFDFEAQMRDLLHQIAPLQTALAGRLSFEPLTAAAERLIEDAHRLRDRCNGADATTLKAINHAMLRASRSTVPVDYTTGDRFQHEPALPVPAWPALQVVRQLAALPADSEDANFLKVDATRARNRICHALREASDALAQALD